LLILNYSPALPRKKGDGEQVGSVTFQKISDLRGVAIAKYKFAVRLIIFMCNAAIGLKIKANFNLTAL
jgi:hypothetical protein